MGFLLKTPTKAAPVYHQRTFKTVETFNHDGLQLARRKRRRRHMPWKEMTLFIVAALAFKVFLYFEMGGSRFGAKVADLQAGAPVERFAGILMEMDPISLFIVDLLRFGL